MSGQRQKIIIKVFRKYSHSLGPEALEFLEEILDQHEIADGDVEYSIEWIAKEYNKQDDAQMKVSVDVLQRVYEAFQGSGDSHSQEHELLDPESHMFVVNAFDMPLWHWSHERSTFERCANH